METPPKYNYAPLENFLEDIGGPSEITNRLETLMQYLVYYAEKEKADGLYETYSDMLEFKQALQGMQTKPAE